MQQALKRIPERILTFDVLYNSWGTILKTVKMTKLDLLLLTLNGAANRILCTIYLAAVHSFFWQNPKASTFVVMVLGSQTFQSGWNCLAQAWTLQAQG